MASNEAHRSFRISIGYRKMMLLGITVSFVLWACSGNKATQPETVATVSAAPVRQTTIDQQITGEAVVYPIHEATIVPKISAPISKFYVNRGDHVRAGELLATLANQDLAAAVAETKGAYEEAQGNYENATKATLPEQMHAARQDVQNARAAFDSAQYLYQSEKALYQQGGLAKAKVDQAQVAMVQARNNLGNAEQHLRALESVGNPALIQAARGQLEAAKGKYEAAKADLGYSEIRSPITGVVTDRPLYEGAMASAGTPLMTIMETSEIVARAHIPQSAAELLHAGDPAELSQPGQSPCPGKVTLVSPALDPDSTTVEVWIQARNQGTQFQPGGTVNVSITAKSAPDALVAPEAAVVMKPNETPYVMVIGSDGRAHRRDVQVGIQQDGKVQITKGVQQGELVVTTGAYGLPDNVKVQMEKTK